tara:strand:- start:104 stop:262 length:159 start_codon:yes stop_codon:yes gene_type:complete
MAAPLQTNQPAGIVVPAKALISPENSLDELVPDVSTRNPLNKNEIENEIENE